MIRYIKDKLDTIRFNRAEKRKAKKVLRDFGANYPSVIKWKANNDQLFHRGSPIGRLTAKNKDEMDSIDRSFPNG